jgi:hypothetical protein
LEEEEEARAREARAESYAGAGASIADGSVVVREYAEFSNIV